MKRVRRYWDSTFKIWREEMEEVELCHNCKVRYENHTIYYKNVKTKLCCVCYVDGGNAPADWHDECMRSYLRQKMELTK